MKKPSRTAAPVSVKPKALGYIRVSTDDQAKEGVSLDCQRERVAAYCLLKGFELVDVIEDAGISAKTLNRPGMQRLLGAVERTEVDAVVVLKLDRMFRSTIDALKTTQDFDRKGIAFHSINESLDTRSAMGRFFFTIMAASAEMERMQIGERTRTALRFKREKREKTGGLVPFGYDVEAGKLIPNDIEQRSIRWILSLRSAGRKYSDIARQLNRRKWKTKTGRDWYPQTVKNVVLSHGGNAV